MNCKLCATAIAGMIWALQGSALAQAEPAAPPAPGASAPSPPADAPSPPADAAAPAQPATPDLAAAKAELEKQIAIQRSDIDEQDAQIRELRQKLKELERRLPPDAPKPAKATSQARPTSEPRGSEPIHVSAYAQGQYESHQDSEDQLLIGGAPLNQDRFLLRRARVKMERQWAYGGLMFELDANTVHGPAIGIQHLEISVGYRDEQRVPFVDLTVGLFDNPFGREVVESPRDRPFMERSFGSREFFPAEPDLGVRLSGQLAWFRYAVAIVNGQPLGDRSGFALQDPNAHKDVLGRVGIVTEPAPALRISGGVSVLNGKGFHAGTDPTKNILIWKDSNEDGQLNTGETRAGPGTAGVASQNFERWALGGDIALSLRTMLGSTTLAAELIAGSNMGRNVFVADPITTSIDERELGYYALLVQEFGFGGIAGFRFDTYNPDADFLDDSRKGKLIPSNETVTTYAPLLGYQVPHHVRVVAEYDVIRDAFARDAQGVPTDKKNNVGILRLQGEL